MVLRIACLMVTPRITQCRYVAAKKDTRAFFREVIKWLFERAE